MRFTIFALAALAPFALAKDFTLYVSTHESNYFVNFPNNNSVEGVQLSDDKGALKVLGSLTFTGPGETMIAMSTAQDTVLWCTVTLTKEAKVDAANLVLRNGAAKRSVIGELRSVGKTKVDSGAVTLDCR